MNFLFALVMLAGCRNGNCQKLEAPPAPPSVVIGTEVAPVPNRIRVNVDTPAARVDVSVHETPRTETMRERIQERRQERRARHGR
jgi:hypothetical protein